MLLHSIEKMAYDIGKDIGHSNDEVQANLLNGFCHALNQIDPKVNKNMQLCYVSDRLDAKTKSLLIELAEFCKPE